MKNKNKKLIFTLPVMVICISMIIRSQTLNGLAADHSVSSPTVYLKIKWETDNAGEPQLKIAEFRDEQELLTALTEALPMSDASTTQQEIASEALTTNLSDETIDSADESIDNTDQTVTEKFVTEPTVGDLILNEIMPAPLSGESEWVEIYNQSDADINLNEVYIMEGSGYRKYLTGEITAKSYLKFEVTKLNNDGDTIILGYREQTLDRLTYGNWGEATDKAPKPSVGENLIRYPDITGTWQVTETPSPGAPNILQITTAAVVTQTVPLPFTTQTVIMADEIESDQTTEQPHIYDDEKSAEELIVKSVVINELMPDPIGTDDGEWLELHNQSDYALDLSGWLIDDAAGGSQPYTLPTDSLIVGGGYLLLNRATTRLALNNDSDSVRLLTPTTQVALVTNYENAITGASYARDTFGEYHWTRSPSPNAKNVFTPVTVPSAVVDEAPVVEQTSNETPDKTVINESAVSDTNIITDLAAVKMLVAGSAVTIEGTISATPGTFGQQLMYLMGGLQIYFYKSEWPVLNIGDRVRIAGELSSSRGETRLKVSATSDIEIINHDEKVEPTPLTIQQINEDAVGDLVIIKGTIAEKKSGQFVLTTEAEEILVVIHESTGIVPDEYKNEQTVTVIGVVRRFNEDLRLYPRSQTDLEIMTEKNETPVPMMTGETITRIMTGNDQGSKITLYLLLTAVAVALALLSLLVRQKFFKSVADKAPTLGDG